MPLFILLVALTGWFTCGLAGAFLSLTLPQDVYQEWPITETLEDVQRCVWLGLNLSTDCKEKGVSFGKLDKKS